MRERGMGKVADKYDAMAEPFEQREAARVEATPEQIKAETIELRKRASVLESLLECMNG
jgi:hypothetical protein